jgi:hypothetical protein
LVFLRKYLVNFNHGKLKAGLHQKKTDAILMVIISLAAGSFLGELLQIEDRLDRLGQWIGRRFSKDDGKVVSKGFVFASLLYCVGAMAIVGSLESGLSGTTRRCSPNRSSMGSARSSLPRLSASGFCSRQPRFLSIKASSR